MIHQQAVDRRVSRSEKREVKAQGPRYELKYVQDRMRRHASDEEILGVAAPVRRSYPNRSVCNVYFDTLDLSCYGESLAGISERVKLRVRWYGQLDQVVRPSVEIKRRRNQIGWKDQYPVGDLRLGIDDWRDIRRQIRSDLPGPPLSVFDRLTNPVLINRYQRSYYESLDGKLRLTIDRDLLFIDQRLRASPNLTFDMQQFEQTIVEVKCSVENRRLATELTRRLGLRRVRMSKYCLGTELLIGEY